MITVVIFLFVLFVIILGGMFIHLLYVSCRASPERVQEDIEVELPDLMPTADGIMVQDIPNDEAIIVAVDM
jgi:hypothetical protein